MLVLVLRDASMRSPLKSVSPNVRSGASGSLSHLPLSQLEPSEPLGPCVRPEDILGGEEEYCLQRKRQPDPVLKKSMTYRDCPKRLSGIDWYGREVLSLATSSRVALPDGHFRLKLFEWLSDNGGQAVVGRYERVKRQLADREGTIYWPEDFTFEGLSRSETEVICQYQVRCSFEDLVDAVLDGRNEVGLLICLEGQLMRCFVSEAAGVTDLKMKYWFLVVWVVLMSRICEPESVRQVVEKLGGFEPYVMTEIECSDNRRTVEHHMYVCSLGLLTQQKYLEVIAAVDLARRSYLGKLAYDPKVCVSHSREGYCPGNECEGFVMVTVGEIEKLRLE